MQNYFVINSLDLLFAILISKNIDQALVLDGFILFVKTESKYTEA